MSTSALSASRASALPMAPSTAGADPAAVPAEGGPLALPFPARAGTVAGGPAIRSREEIHFTWLLRLRWAAVLGQTGTIVTVDQVMGIRLPLGPLALLIGLAAASNLAGQLWSARRRPVTEGLLAAVMAFDVLVLTGLLYFSGGPFNPFSFAYLVQIALATMLLRPRSAWLLAGLSLVGSAVLFLDHRPLAQGRLDHAVHLQTHLYGMWVAFGVTASFIVYFLARVKRALAEREAELAAARELSERNDRLASLATLAAGAAHELATPLSTIAVVARELERMLEQAPGAAEALADVRLVREQVARCRAILDGMSADACVSAGESPSLVEPEALLASVLEGVADTHEIVVEVAPALRGRPGRVPQRALAQALRVLVKNAEEATPPRSRITLGAAPDGDILVITVADPGCGMSPEVLRRAGEPFFTTKSPGHGMGLGLFLARTLVERLGGTLTLHSEPAQGTVVRVRLPWPGLAAPASREMRP